IRVFHVTGVQTCALPIYIGFSVENKARIFKVVKTPVRAEAHPEKLQNILGYEFFSTDPATGRIKEFSSVFGQQYELAYWEKLDRSEERLVGKEVAVGDAE